MCGIATVGGERLLLLEVNRLAYVYILLGSSVVGCGALVQSVDGVYIYMVMLFLEVGASSVVRVRCCCCRDVYRRRRRSITPSRCAHTCCSSRSVDAVKSTCAYILFMKY